MQSTMKPSEAASRHRRILWLVLTICIAPVILSYLSYYVFRPQMRNNYGTLLDPRRFPVPELHATTADGQPASLNDLHRQWVLLQVDRADCETRCADKLYYMRQLRAAQGKDADRIARVWLVTDKAPLSVPLMKIYDGTHILRVDASAVARWLPVEAGTRAEDHLYLIDPLGNLMMRFPKDPDYNKVKQDLNRLLKASRIG